MNIAKKILEELQTGLAEDGYERSGQELFYKELGRGWGGWISIDSDSWQFGVVIGIYNKNLVRLSAVAFERIGLPVPRMIAGPPFIMMNLTELTKKDPAYAGRQSWVYTGRKLSDSVADDILYCLRNVAYPYFERIKSIEAIVEENRNGRLSLSTHLYLPIMLIIAGKIDEMREFIKRWVENNKDLAQQMKYDEYIETILEMIAESRPET